MLIKKGEKKEEGTIERNNIMSDILSMSHTVSPSPFISGPVFKTTSSLSEETHTNKGRICEGNPR